MRGEDEEVHTRVGLGQRLTLQHSGELGARQALAQPVLQSAMADDKKAEVGNSHPL